MTRDQFISALCLAGPLAIAAWMGWLTVREFLRSCAQPKQDTTCDTRAFTPSGSAIGDRRLAIPLSAASAKSAVKLPPHALRRQMLRNILTRLNRN